MPGCEFCGGPVERRHHPTERDERGRYMDYDFVQNLCHDHHELVHDDSYTLGWEKLDPKVPLTWFDRVELRLRRWAAYMARLEASSRGPTVWGYLAPFLVRWADELALGIGVLDEHVPSWRRLHGMVPE